MTTVPATSSPDVTTHAAVELVNVTKRFDGAAAVDRLSLAVTSGEFFALLGPSGCGKTTTLRMIGGFDDPTEGRILLEGVDITGVPPHRRNLNTVFQSYALFPHLDVFDNVAFGLRRRHVERSTIAGLVHENLELVGLKGFERRPSHQLSGGQQQRVALARALVNQPKVLLLDEPMGALDAKIRQSMRAELKRIQREVGITFIYVTHDQDEAMSLGDRVAVMRSGRFEDLGEPHRVYDRPASRFTAEFLGTCNFIPVDGDGRLPGGAVAAVEGNSGPMSSIGVRPEKVRLTASPPVDSPPNVVSAVVTSATYLGSATDYELRSAWGGSLHALVQSTGDEDRFTAGQSVSVCFSPQHCFALTDPGTP